MAKKKDTTFFENKLLDFVTAKDPMLEMLQWVMDKFMFCFLPTRFRAMCPIYYGQCAPILRATCPYTTGNAPLYYGQHAPILWARCPYAMGNVPIFL